MAVSSEPPEALLTCHMQVSWTETVTGPADCVWPCKLWVALQTVTGAANCRLSYQNIACVFALLCRILDLPLPKSLCPDAWLALEDNVTTDCHSCDMATIVCTQQHIAVRGSYFEPPNCSRHTCILMHYQETPSHLEFPAHQSRGCVKNALQGLQGLILLCRLSPADVNQVLQQGMGWTAKQGHSWPEDLQSCEESGCYPNADPSKVCAFVDDRLSSCTLFEYTAAEEMHQPYKTSIVHCIPELS